MRTIALLLTLVAVAPQDVTDQKPVVPEGTIITSVEVTGFDMDRRAPAFDTRFVRSQAPRSTSSASTNSPRASRPSDPDTSSPCAASWTPRGQARVFFVMGRQEQPERDDTNINDCYIVEDADITGVSEKS